MQDKKPFIAIGAVLLAAIGVIAYALQQTSGPAFEKPPTTTSTPAATKTDAGPAPTPFIMLPPHSRGNKAAAVKLEEFGDYQCPSCAFMFQELKKIEAEYAGRIQFSFSHFPIVARHPYAMIAVRAAEAANLQGKFWEMHDKLYEAQKDWGFIDKDDKPAKTEAEVREMFVTYAGELKLDVAKFKQDLEKPELEKQATSDLQRGQSLGVRGTPALFMSSPMMQPNQLKPEMMTPDGIRKALDYLIEQSGGAPVNGAKPPAKADDKPGAK
jgi:protein-disulfide isomerase